MRKWWRERKERREREDSDRQAQNALYVQQIEERRRYVEMAIKVAEEQARREIEVMERNQRLMERYAMWSSSPQQPNPQWKPLDASTATRLMKSAPSFACPHCRDVGILAVRKDQIRDEDGHTIGYDDRTVYCDCIVGVTMGAKATAPVFKFGGF